MRPFAPSLSVVFAVSIIVLACAGCVAEPEPQPMVTNVTSEVAPDDPNCIDYRAQAAVEGQPGLLVGRACRQKDGIWRVSEGPDGAPPQTIALYAPPQYDYDPWLAEFPIGFSLGNAVVFVDRQHHLHHVMAVRGLRRVYVANRGGLHPAPVRPAVVGGMHRG
jgi:hypothetical protein